MDYIGASSSKLRTVSRTSQGRILLIVLCTAALALAVVQSSSADPGHDPYTSPYFTPTVEIESDDTTAGAHPNLTIKMRKLKPNGCSLDYPWIRGGCFDPDPYIEQDLRDWKMSLPPGLMADIQATPKRCNDPKPDPDTGYRDSCPGESKIGEVFGKLIVCNPQDHGGGCTKDSPDVEDLFTIKGEVFMGVPNATEQARLHMLVGPVWSGNDWYVMRVDTKVRVRQAAEGLEIEAETTDVPDILCLSQGGLEGCSSPFMVIAAQIERVEVTLHGGIGADRRHPMLTNPTSCHRRDFGSTFRGYAGFSFAPSPFNYHPGEGYGNTVTDTAPFPVTGCNLLDYSPSLSMGMSPNTPGAIPALTTTLSQDEGEQTTKEVKVRFPRGIGVNLQNKVSACSQDNFSADTCPEGSRIGSVVAKSKLVPEGELAGSIYLGKAGDGSFPLILSLKGFVDLALQGKVAVSSDGTLEATFSNLPEVPIESFTLNLDGSTERGMLKVPASCRHSEVETLFTSHQGKEHKVTTQLDIGCNQASLSVDVDPQKTRSHPTVTLEAKASGIEDVSFRLPKNLKVKSSGLVTSGRSYGTLGLEGLDGRDSLSLKPVSASSRAKSTTFAATSSGDIRSMATAAPGRVIQSCKPARRKSKGKKRARSAKKRTAKKRTRGCKRTASGGTVLSFTDLPEDLTSVTVELEGEKSNLLTTPSKCIKKKKPKLDFSATISDVKGTTYRPTKSVTLKCAKKAKKQRSKRSSGKRSKKRR